MISKPMELSTYKALGDKTNSCIYLPTLQRTLTHTSPLGLMISSDALTDSRRNPLFHPTMDHSFPRHQIM